MSKKVKRILLGVTVFILFLCVFLYIDYMNKGKFTNDGKLLYNGEYYHQIEGAYSYATNNPEGYIGKTKKHTYYEDGTGEVTVNSYDIYAVAGDKEHNFLILEVPNVYGNLYVKVDYEIPKSGKITRVYVADLWESHDREFCEAINGVVYGGFTKSTEKLYIYTNYMPNIYDIMLSFNGCPVGTEFVGYIGVVNDKWVYIPGKMTAFEIKNSERPSKLTCYVIEDYKKIKKIKKFFESELEL